MGIIAFLLPADSAIKRGLGFIIINYPSICFPIFPSAVKRLQRRRRRSISREIRSSREEFDLGEKWGRERCWTSTTRRTSTLRSFRGFGGRRTSRLRSEWCFPWASAATPVAITSTRAPSSILARKTSLARLWFFFSSFFLLCENLRFLFGFLFSLVETLTRNVNWWEKGIKEFDLMG